MSPGTERLAAVSVDLDEIPCYAAIYGIEPPRESAHAIYDHALDRLLRVFDDERVRATFFAIGSDLGRAENAIALRAASNAGHEVASHSMSHLYDLVRRDRATIEREIDEAHDAIERAVGKAPVGFRAPGYTISDTVFDVLESRGYEYDSSVFPCPPYYAAKAAAIGAIAARGRTSRSIVDDPRVLAAPADPYRVGRPYWHHGRGLRELPIGVTRGARLPYIGTTVVMAGERGARLLTRGIVGRPVVSLELHGIDLSDAEADGLEWLRPHQQDLKRTAKEKEAALRAALGALRDAGYRFVTCAQAADAQAVG